MTYDECLDLSAKAEMAHIEKRLVCVDPLDLIGLCREAWEPHLGCATTAQLRQELEARGPDSPDHYKTFDRARDALAQRTEHE